MTGDGQRLKTCWKYFNPPKRLEGARFDNYVIPRETSRPGMDYFYSAPTALGKPIWLLLPFGH